MNDLSALMELLKHEMPDIYAELHVLNAKEQVNVLNSVLGTEFEFKDLTAQKHKVHYREHNPESEFTCKECGKVDKTARSYKIFCSRACEARFNKRIISRLETEARRIDVICPVCQSTFKTSFGQKYCQKCAKIGYKMAEKAWKRDNAARMKELRARYMKSEHGIKKKKEEYIKVTSETREQSINTGTYKSPYGQNEDRFILENWDKMTKEAIAKALNRPYLSIRSRYLKLTKEK
jgi:hypothetical protein